MCNGLQLLGSRAFGPAYQSDFVLIAQLPKILVHLITRTLMFFPKHLTRLNKNVAPVKKNQELKNLLSKIQILIWILKFREIKPELVDATASYVFFYLYMIFLLFLAPVKGYNPLLCSLS